MSLVKRVAHRYLAARQFSSPEALKRYLQQHPKADPSKHTVKGKPEQGKGKPEQDGLDALKGLGKGQRKRVLERALEMNEAQSEGRKPKNLKDHSKEEGFEVLKDLSHSEQRKVIERALKQQG